MTPQDPTRPPSLPPCPHCKPPLPVGAQITGAIFIVGLIWAGGAAYQRLASLEEWRTQTQASRFTNGDASQMRTQIDSEIQRARTELEAEIRTERAFSRALCFAIDNLQERADIPQTNDCARP